MLLSDRKQLIYTPQADRPMHVVVFGSGSGTNLKALLSAQSELHPLFEVKALVTDRKCRIHDIASRERIPLIYHPFVTFFREQGVTDYQDPKLRIAYDAKTLELLLQSSKEHHYSIDLIFLAGYMRLLYPPLLSYFSNKILNVHPADLTSKDDHGKRKYTGANAVFDALSQGEKETRSSVILVDENVDTGPILVSGPSLTYTEGYPVTLKRASYHQEKQKMISDWKACIQAIALIAEGRISLDENRHVYIDNKPATDAGYIMENKEA